MQENDLKIVSPIINSKENKFILTKLQSKELYLLNVHSFVQNDNFILNTKPKLFKFYEMLKLFIFVDLYNQIYLIYDLENLRNKYNRKIYYYKDIIDLQFFHNFMIIISKTKIEFFDLLKFDFLKDFEYDFCKRNYDFEYFSYVKFVSQNIEANFQLIFTTENNKIQTLDFYYFDLLNGKKSYILYFIHI